MLNPDSPILVIPDLQIPFEHQQAFNFCRYLRRHYRIVDENILNVGDETDSYHGGNWPKDPNGHFTASSELGAAREKLKEWISEFPHMKVAISNHGLRWVRKATAAEIPSQLIRSYHDIFNIPDTWVYQQEWRFEKQKHPFRMIHGMGYSGKDGHRNAALDSNYSTIIGHLHSHAAIDFIKLNGGQQIWAVNTGCLIDVDAYAFEYEKYNRTKPILGATVIFKDGKMPVFHPM